MGQNRQRLLLRESLSVKFPLPLALGISQRAMVHVSNTKLIFFPPLLRHLRRRIPVSVSYTLIPVFLGGLHRCLFMHNVFLCCIYHIITLCVSEHPYFRYERD